MDRIPQQSLRTSAVSAPVRPGVVTLSAHQLREALEFATPAQTDCGQAEKAVSIGYFEQTPVGQDEVLPAGYYCWLDDYPEEGRFHLPGAPASLGVAGDQRLLQTPNDGDLARQLAMRAIKTLGERMFTVFAILDVDQPKTLENFQRFGAVLEMAFLDGRDTALSSLPRSQQAVIAERLRQTGEERIANEHDDTYDRGELALAAACFAVKASIDATIDLAVARQETVPPHWLPILKASQQFLDACWPWSGEVIKPAPPYRNLEKAGAMVLAEMERRDRASVHAPDHCPSSMDIAL